MCTRVLTQCDGGPVLVGRNMDWPRDMATNLWVLPRGAERTGLPGDTLPLTWTSQYGSVVAVVYGLGAADGVNEKGLAAHLLWLAESDYGAREETRPALGVCQWAQYFLDKFSTVAQCLADMEQNSFQVRPQDFPNPFPDHPDAGEDAGKDTVATVHLALEDATGDSAVIEYIGGKPVVHHDRSYTVATNSPPFDQQLEHLKQYEGLGGRLPLPGTTGAADRFVRASYYAANLPKASTRDWSYAALLSVMRNAAQPFGTADDPDNPNTAMTVWRTLTDLTNGVYAFESSFRPDIVWVDLKSLDFTHTQLLDLQRPEPVRVMNERFTPHTPFTPA